MTATRKLIRCLRRLLLLGSLLVLLAGVVFHWVLPYCVRLPKSLSVEDTSSPVFRDRHGKELRRLLEETGRRAGVVRLEEVPEGLVSATLSAEDKRFFRHGGIDYLATLRAARDLLRHRQIVSGASTITQQLIKLSGGMEAERTVARKLYEMLCARQLEMKWSKERIFAAYFNRLDYGNFHRGCRSAALGYFGKPLGDLSLAESAFLAGLPQSPSRLDPYRNWDAARRRQAEVLRRVSRAYPDLATDVERAEHEPLALVPRRNAFEAPHFVDHLLATQSFDKRDFPLQTTLDLALQHRCEALLRRQVESLRDRDASNGAVVVLENATGDILAMVGSIDHADPNAGQVNGATSPRSPGSALKPFTYLLAMEQGMTPATIVADVPTEYMTPTGIYRPVNYHQRYAGPVSIREALGNSLNVPAVRVLQQIGGAEVLLGKLRELGVRSMDGPANHYGLGLTIGNAPVSLLELTNAYACLARLGEWKPWRCRSQAVPSAGRRVWSEAQAYLIADILSDPQARLRSFGPQSPMQLPFRIACKTGTSSSFRDSWAIGYTPEHTVGVWLGNFDGSSMREVSGATGPVPVMRDIFKELYARREPAWFAPPAKVTEAVVDRRNGKLLMDGLAQRYRVFARKETFVSGQLPPPASARDYDEVGRALLPETFRAWFESSESTDWSRFSVPRREEMIAEEVLAITFPQPGTVIYLDPVLPNQGKVMTLEASRREGIAWSSRTLETRDEDGRVRAILRPGRHEMTVVDSRTGEQATTWVEVRQL